MNGISHKQAVQWIHRRLDGLLNEDQLLALEEHLQSCEFCRTYAAELDSLPAELQGKFHARWDEESGPSRRVMAYVTTRARKIHISNRISSGATLLAGAMALIVLAVAINFVVSRLQSTSPVTNPTENPSPRAEDRLLAFASDQNGNFDIYTMRADSSELTNLTSNPAADISPFWSPDGKHITFESDRDGFGQIYLMDADGSNVVQLTKDEAHHRFLNFVNDFSPWSSDGSKLIFAETLPGEEKWKLYVMDVNGENKTPLVDEPGVYAAISWSPDARHIALLADDPQNLGGDRLYVVNADGSHFREITKSFPPNEQLSTSDYYWSQDGQSIFFVALFQKTDPYWTAYEARLDYDSLIAHATTNDMMYGWWNDISIVNNFSASSPFEWLRPDGTSSTLNPLENCQHIDLYQSDNTVKRSSHGNWVITGQCANGDTWFYWANSDGSRIKLLLDSPIPITDTFLSPASWSQDDKFVAFIASSSDKSDLYILNVSEALTDPSIQPLKISHSFSPSWQLAAGENTVRELPTPQPTP